jgi:hypothetical protein
MRETERGERKRDEKKKKAKIRKKRFSDGGLTMHKGEERKLTKLG